MQLLLVLVVIFVPQSVTAFLDKPEVVDVNSVVLEASPVAEEPQNEELSTADLMKNFSSGEAR